MPIRMLPTAGSQYFLLCFDKDGEERLEDDGGYLRPKLLETLKSEQPTDIFVISHGWMGDVPAAIAQYDRWIAAFLSVGPDLEAAKQRSAGFHPVVVGLHWPSLPWGEESLALADPGVLSAADDPHETDGVAWWAERIADSPTAREALSTILSAAQQGTAEQALSPEVRESYQRLFRESGLAVGDRQGKPGADQESFDIDAIIADSPRFKDPAPTGAPGVLGSSVWDGARELVLAPLRTLSFWKMKDRARAFGEGAAHALVQEVQGVAPNSRIHLMGHSFGCIVVSSAVAGPESRLPLPRPIDTLFLVQGALSLWAFAEEIPYAEGAPGYFRALVDEKRVRGPILATTSRFDTAVGRYYPAGAHIANQYLLTAQYPEYGGIGTFGIQGSADTSALDVKDIAERYDFLPSCIYNIDCSSIIRNGSGPSGAHCDIAHPEIAHLFWSGMLRQAESATLDVATLSAPNSFIGLLDADDSNDGVAAAGGGESAEIPVLGDFTMRGYTPSPNASESSAETPRYLTADVEDRSPETPLMAGSWYTLSFGVDLQVGKETVGAAPLVNVPFEPGVESVLVSIQLDSDDFSIATKILPLEIKRTGASRVRTKFGVSPVRDGKAVIRATVHKDGNFIQEIKLTFDIGAGASSSVQTDSRGRQVAAADTLNPRAVSLIIEPRDGCYDCRVVGSVATRAQLQISPNLLANEIKLARQALLAVVTTKVGSDLPFQSKIEIDEAASRRAFHILSAAGARLYRKLFYGPDAKLDSISLAEYLKKMFLESSDVLNIQVSAEKLPIPWALLYLGEPGDESAAPTWEKFLGFRHIVEQIPLQNIDPVRTPIIASMPELCLGTCFNIEIDRQFKVALVADQIEFWKTAQNAQPTVAVSQRRTRQEVMDALCDAQLPDQILYFYCHAVSYDLSDARDPGTSKLKFADGEITLEQLQEGAPITRTLIGRPMAFINACESAELSALFYDGFVPYFVARGGRGVIGTECSMPALFAADWAREFFVDFLNGSRLGDVIFKLRKRYVEKYRNPLGLLYAVYCDPNTQIQPALTIRAAA